jgi:CubicO group peptidase (beta-lactamase class C family)
MTCSYVLRRWVTVLLLTCFVSVGAPQKLAAQQALPGPANQRLGAATQGFALPSTARLDLKPDPKARARLRRAEKPTGDWGKRWKGKNCPPAAELKSLVDDYLATPHPDFPDLGSPVPGLSVSWSSDDCGTFTYAAGLRNVEDGEMLTPRTLMGIASMTKPIVAAVTLRLSESGVFGPRGLDTPVARLLTSHQIATLTVGDDPTNPRCPGETFLFNRETGEFEWRTFSCPDLSRVTLRHLMISNHGMYDFLNEVQLPDHPWDLYSQGLYFELCPFFGLICVPPVSSHDGFDYLKAFGLKRYDGAGIGGNLYFRDFETSLGNTGFQLLGVILEAHTGKSLNRLIRELIVKPLGIDDMVVYVDPDKRRNLIADGYQVSEPVFEESGVYPLVEFNGHTLVNNRSLGLGLPANINSAGGAGGVIANPRSYRRFLDALVNGGLLGRAAQRELDRSYVMLPDISSPEVVQLNGFGLAKQRVRGHSEFPDSDVYFHEGSLPGIRCSNGVVKRPHGNGAAITGVICANMRDVSYDTFILWNQFVLKIVGGDS